MTPLDPTFGPTYRPGDRLAAGDLTEWQHVPLFAHARHFRTLHQFYGVASGAGVRLTPHGDREWKLTVERGTAFDALGRPLRLLEPFEAVLATSTVTVPAGEGRTKEEPVWEVQRGPGLEPGKLSDEAHLIVLRGAEPGRGALGVEVPAPSRPAEVVLVPASAELSPWEVPLARLEPPQQPPGRELNLRARENAVRGFRRPYLATGTLPAGTTAVPVGGGRAGWRVWVSTRAAGFLPVPERRPGLAPVYLVTVGTQSAQDAARLLTGNLIVEPALVEHLTGPPPGSAFGAPDLGAATAGPAVTLSDVRDDGFMVTVEYLGIPPKQFENLRATPLAIRWLGVEQRRAGRTERAAARTEAVIVRESTDRTPLPWPSFHDGQRLSPDDLNDVKQTVRELQWLHNRTLHDWGVADGYEVAPLSNKRGVQVRRGVAYDIQGRELLLGDLVELSLPPQGPRTGPDEEAEWWVTATYRDVPAERGADPSCRLDGVPLRRIPQAAVRWRNPRDKEPETRLVPGVDVILATVRVARGEVVEVSAVGRRSAVPPRRPYIAAGRTPREVEWGLWPDSKGDEPITGVWVRVDTTSGGFVSNPQYIVQLERTEPEKEPEFPTRVRGWSREDQESFRNAVAGLNPFRYFIVDPTANSFRVVILFDTPVVPTITDLLRRLRRSEEESLPARIRALFDDAAADSEERRQERSEWKKWAGAVFPWRFAWVGIEV